MANTKITPQHNGPIRIEGEFEICDPEGKLFGPAGRTVISLCRCGQSPTSLSATAPTAAPASSTPSRLATCRRPCRSCNQESGGATRESVQHRVAFVPQLLDQPSLRGVVEIG